MNVVGKGEVVFLGRTFKEAMSDIVALCPALADLDQQEFTITWREEAVFDEMLSGMFWLVDLSDFLKHAYIEAGVKCADISGNVSLGNESLSIRFTGRE